MFIIILEHFWISLFMSQILNFYLQLHMPSPVHYFVEKLFTFTTYLVIFMHLWCVLLYISNYIPISLIYIYMYGQKDPLIDLQLPSWV